MKKNLLNLSELGAVELTLNELVEFEGGSFWKTLGYIVGAVAVVAIAYYAPAALILLKAIAS